MQEVASYRGRPSWSRRLPPTGPPPEPTPCPISRTASSTPPWPMPRSRAGRRPRSAAPWPMRARPPPAPHAACPRGAVDLALHFHRRDDERMVGRLRAEDLSEMRYRDRVVHAVRTRLEIAEPNREAVRRGLTLFSLPMHATEGMRATWGTADAIWDALGDTSDDVNWYSKRAILSGGLRVHRALLAGRPVRRPSRDLGLPRSADRRRDAVREGEGADARLAAGVATDGGSGRDDPLAHPRARADATRRPARPLGAEDRRGRGWVRVALSPGVRRRLLVGRVGPEATRRTSAPDRAHIARLGGASVIGIADSPAAGRGPASQAARSSGMPTPA